MSTAISWNPLKCTWHSLGHLLPLLLHPPRCLWSYHDPMPFISSSTGDADFLSHFNFLLWGNRNFRILSWVSWVSMSLDYKWRSYHRPFCYPFLYEDYGTNLAWRDSYKPFGLPRRAEGTRLRNFVSLDPPKHIWNSH